MRREGVPVVGISKLWMTEQGASHFTADLSDVIFSRDIEDVSARYHTRGGLLEATETDEAFRNVLPGGAWRVICPFANYEFT